MSRTRFTDPMGVVVLRRWENRHSPFCAGWVVPCLEWSVVVLRDLFYKTSSSPTLPFFLSFSPTFLLPTTYDVFISSQRLDLFLSFPSPIIVAPGADITIIQHCTKNCRHKHRTAAITLVVSIVNRYVG